MGIVARSDVGMMVMMGEFDVELVLRSGVLSEYEEASVW